MALTFAQLKAEVIARGFDSLTDARAGIYVNAARADLDRMYLWPWRQKLSTGAAPLTVSDLGRIERVVNTSNASSRLYPADYQTLVDNYGDLSVGGSPTYYYVVWTSGTPVVTTYPASTNTLGVRYWKVTADLSAAGDVPAAPAEAHYLIVDLAVRRAYHDNDEHDQAVALQPEIENAVAQLLDQYPPGQADGPDSYVGVNFESEDW